MKEATWHKWQVSQILMQRVSESEWRIRNVKLKNDTKEKICTKKKREKTTALEPAKKTFVS